jgi:hypothetical protein
MARIGVEWVRQYHGRANELTNTKSQVEGLYNHLSGTKAFNWGDDLAWDRDFEEQGAGSPASGTDSTWVDTVDIAMFSGHGSPSGLLFGIADKDNGLTAPSEMRLGNNNLEWLILDACQVLQRDDLKVFDRVKPIFKGLHYVLGFDTLCLDEAHRGEYMADYLNDGDRMRDAWRKTCQETEGSDHNYAYVRADASGTNTFEDHWHGKGFVSSDPSTPTKFFYLRDSC